MQRWTPKRKASILESITKGYTTEAEVMAMHNISREELDWWMTAFATHGRPALRVTRTQSYYPPGDKARRLKPKLHHPRKRR